MRENNIIGIEFAKPHKIDAIVNIIILNIKYCFLPINLLKKSTIGIITPLAAVSLLIFSLLYTPCVAAIASIRRELGTRWAAYIVVAQCAIAWGCAFIVKIVGTLIGAV